MRQVIKAIDIQVFFGKGESMSFKLLKGIKKELKKQPHQPITVEEFCNYYKISRTEIEPIIVQNDSKKSERLQKTNTAIQSTSLITEIPTSTKTKHAPYQFS